MKEINSTFTNKLTSLIWSPMTRILDDNFKVRSVTRNQLEWKLHDRLEDRIKFKVMIPIEWRMNSSL
jgi:hypothetical protein